MAKSRIIGYSIVALAVMAGLATRVPLPFNKLEGSRIAAYVPHARSLPPILVVGDSIALQYLPTLHRLLADCANVHRLIQPRKQTIWQRLDAPKYKATNAKGSKNIAQNIGLWLGNKQAELAVINTGLHDLENFRNPKTHSNALSDYTAHLGHILRTVKKHARHVIFIATTPVADTAPPPFSNDHIDQLNHAAAKLTKSLDIEFLEIDLGPQHGDIYQSDGIHLSAVGRDLMAGSISAHLKHRLAGKLPAQCEEAAL